MYTLLLKQNGFYNVIRSDKPQSRIEAIRKSTLGIGGTRQLVLQLAIQALYDEFFPEVDDDAC